MKRCEEARNQSILTLREKLIFSEDPTAVEQIGQVKLVVVVVNMFEI
jgi:hypothetical protein